MCRSRTTSNIDIYTNAAEQLRVCSPSCLPAAAAVDGPPAPCSTGSLHPAPACFAPPCHTTQHDPLSAQVLACLAAQQLSSYQTLQPPALAASGQLAARAATYYDGQVRGVMQSAHTITTPSPITPRAYCIPYACAHMLR